VTASRLLTQISSCVLIKNLLSQQNKAFSQSFEALPSKKTIQNK